MFEFEEKRKNIPNEELLATMNIMTDVLNFLYATMPTLVGGALAFFLGFRLYKKQKHEENKSYLHYSVAALGYLDTQLYTFKEQIAQKRYQEAQIQKEKIEKNLQGQHEIDIELRKTANLIYGADFQIAIGMEKLEFLVKRNPNLLILLGALINSVKSLNHIVTDINSEVFEYSRQTKSLNNLNRILLMLQKNILLYEQLDNTIYLNEKFLGLIIEFGHLEYKKEMKIKTLEHTDEKYKKLKPKPIKSWEDYDDWFPKKRSLMHRVLAKIGISTTEKR